MEKEAMMQYSPRRVTGKENIPEGGEANRGNKANQL